MTGCPAEHFAVPVPKARTRVTRIAWKVLCLEFALGLCDSCFVSYTRKSVLLDLIRITKG
jgi:hypothetical protein